MRHFVEKTFSSLKHKNFKLFFIGQSISLSGSWMQQTAMSWLVYEMTGSKYLLGLVAALGLFPMLFLSLFSGVIADKYPKRITLIYAQLAQMICAFILGGLALSNIIEVWHIEVLAFLTGIAFAIDLPVKHSFYVEIVDKEDLMNAIALNSSMVNLARVVGPVFAGVIMSITGADWCFILNGLTFFAVIVSLLKIKVNKIVIKEKKDSTINLIKAGFVYIRNNRRILNLMILMTVVCLFGWSYLVLIPAVAKDVFMVGEEGYATIMAFNGIGALIAALFIAYLGNSKHSRAIVNNGLYLFSGCLILVALCHNYLISVMLMTLAGFGLISYFSASSGLIQASSSDQMRGRVMGVWSLVFGGMQPIGSLLIGYLGDKIGISMTLVFCACMCITATFLISFFKQHKETEECARNKLASVK